MTDDEWYASDDPIAMIDAIRGRWRGEDYYLERLVRAYLLKSCRAIWKLLPLEGSRRGVEVAERDLDFPVDSEEYQQALWHCEGAKWFLREWEHDEEIRDEQLPFDLHWGRSEADRRSRIRAMVRDVEAIPAARMRRMVRPSAGGEPVTPRLLLYDAASFAFDSIVYHDEPARSRHLVFGPPSRQDGALREYPQFLSPRVLRRLLGKPPRCIERDPDPA